MHHNNDRSQDDVKLDHSTRKQYKVVSQQNGRRLPSGHVCRDMGVSESRGRGGCFDLLGRIDDSHWGKIGRIKINIIVISAQVTRP